MKQNDIISIIQDNDITEYYSLILILFLTFCTLAFYIKPCLPFIKGKQGFM